MCLSLQINWSHVPGGSLRVYQCSTRLLFHRWDYILNIDAYMCVFVLVYWLNNLVILDQLKFFKVFAMLFEFGHWPVCYIWFSFIYWLNNLLVSCQLRFFMWFSFNLNCNEYSQLKIVLLFFFSPQEMVRACDTWLCTSVCLVLNH